jgi:hypothetical protein
VQALDNPTYRLIVTDTETIASESPVFPETSEPGLIL